MWCVGIILVVYMRYDYVCKDRALEGTLETMYVHSKEGRLNYSKLAKSQLEKLFSWYSSSPTAVRKL